MLGEKSTNPPTADRPELINGAPGPKLELQFHEAMLELYDFGFHGFWPPGFTANGHPVSPELATLFHG